MIAAQLKAVVDTLPTGVRLVAVSKFHPASAIQEAYDAGQRVFGESKAQELEEKHKALPKDIEWHFIGHLQTNKVKYIAPYVAMIHSIDSLHLLQEVDRQALRAGRRVDCLLQIHIAQEQTKFGLSEEECRELLDSGEWRLMSGIRICGLMGMASFTDDEEVVSQEFAGLAAFFREVKDGWFAHAPYFRELSMGMSDDYRLAIKEGSTLVRVGSLIFGQRHYA